MYRTDREVNMKVIEGSVTAPKGYEAAAAAAAIKYKDRTDMALIYSQVPAAAAEVAEAAEPAATALTKNTTLPSAALRTERSLSVRKTPRKVKLSPSPCLLRKDMRQTA